MQHGLVKRRLGGNPGGYYFTSIQFDTFKFLRTIFAVAAVVLQAQSVSAMTHPMGRNCSRVRSKTSQVGKLMRLRHISAINNLELKCKWRHKAIRDRTRNNLTEETT